MATTSVPVEAVDLLTQIMTANAAHTQGISNTLLAGFKAERDAIYDGVRHGLGTIEEGGTVRQYEDGLWLIEQALVPTHEVRDFYLRRAERWLAGEHDSPGYYRAKGGAV